MKYIFCIMLFLLGGFIILYYDLYPHYQARQARQNWRKESAVIVADHSIPSEFDGDTYSQASYQYHFSGREYLGRRISFGTRIPYLSKEISAGYTVPCYVNPANPEESVLFLDVQPAPIRFFGYGFLALALVCPLLSLLGEWRNQRTQNPAEVEHAIARSPLSRRFLARSGSFSLYKMDENDELCIIRPTIGYYLFSGVWIAGGIYVTTQKSADGMLILLCIGLVGIMIGLAFLGGAKKMVFDGRTDSFHIRPLLLPGGQKTIPYRDIQALQLLHKCEQGSEGGYDVFEMNLVLTDHSRVFVVGWHTPLQARQNAAIISARIGGVPVMDHIGDTLNVFL